MVTVISRFRVRNGMEDRVREAFQQRPGRVEEAEGFLGLEVHTDAEDPAIFYLVTRWLGREHFEAWHGSEEHKASHEGIPDGLKLDAEYTQVTVMERFHPEGETQDGAAWLERARHAAAQFTGTSPDVHVILTDREGRIRRSNGAAASWLGRSAEELEGSSVLDLMVEHDREKVREVLDEGPGTARTLKVSLVDRTDHPYAVEGLVRVEPGQVVLLGSPRARELHDLQSRLLEVNNELATTARENERRRRELERTKNELQETLDELNESYWHLKKIQEVLPICMSCGKVKTGDAEWQDVVDYLQEHSLFLSHGYCPDCKEEVMAEFRGEQSG